MGLGKLIVSGVFDTTVTAIYQVAANKILRNARIVIASGSSVDDTSFSLMLKPSSSDAFFITGAGHLLEAGEEFTFPEDDPEGFDLETGMQIRGVAEDDDIVHYSVWGQLQSL